MLCGSRNPTEPTTQLLIRARETFPYNGGMALLGGKLRRGVARLNSRGHRRSAHNCKGMCPSRPACLEPISKSLEEDNEASELYEAEEVLGVVFPTDEDAALPLNPSKEALHEPASHIAA